MAVDCRAQEKTLGASGADETWGRRGRSGGERGYRSATWALDRLADLHAQYLRAREHTLGCSDQMSPLMGVPRGKLIILFSKLGGGREGSAWHPRRPHQ